MKHTKLQFAQESYYEMATRINKRIALEAGFLANLGQSVREILPNLFNSASEHISSIKFVSTSPEKTSERPGFLQLLDKHNYVHISSLNVTVPEGFNGNLAEYSGILEKCSKHASELIAEVLNPYNTFLSKLLSSQNARQNNYAELNYLAKRDVLREQLNVEVGKHFRAGSVATTQPMGKVIARMVDWDNVILTMPRITKNISFSEQSAVQKAVDECVALIDSIRGVVSEGELDGISGPMMKQLSEATLSVAREVEFYSITAFRIKMLDVAINDTIDHFKKSLK